MMLTRCPGCTTTFRVTPEQVKARHGKVRCGRCQHVFDAIEHLVDADVVPLQPPAAEATTVPVETIEAAEVVSVPAPMPEPIAPIPEEPQLAEETSTTEPPTPPSAPAEDDILLQPSPLSEAYGPKPTRTPTWPWTIASLVVLGALTAQLMVAFRTELAVKYPSLRPALEVLCDQAHCTIELPSNPELVSIEASDLHPAKKGGLELTATLRNRAPNAQSWPHLELTLTDGADKPIVRKIITPAQYLPATLAEAEGFEANGELAVQLQLDPGNLPAAGYRLYLFYP